MKFKKGKAMKKKISQVLIMTMKVIGIKVGL